MFKHFIRKTRYKLYKAFQYVNGSYNKPTDISRNIGTWQNVFDNYDAPDLYQDYIDTEDNNYPLIAANDATRLATFMCSCDIAQQQMQKAINSLPELLPDLNQDDDNDFDEDDDFEDYDPDEEKELLNLKKENLTSSQDLLLDTQNLMISSRNQICDLLPIFCDFVEENPIFIEKIKKITLKKDNQLFSYCESTNLENLYKEKASILSDGQKERLFTTFKITP